MDGLDRWERVLGGKLPTRQRCEIGLLEGSTRKSSRKRPVVIYRLYDAETA